MSKSLPLLFRHAMYNLRGGFLIRPLTIALCTPTRKLRKSFWQALPLPS